MDQRLARIVSAVWWGAVILLIAQIATTSTLRYLAGSEAPPPPIVANAFANPFLVAHVITGMIALVIGPLQFVSRIRTRAPGVHRATGLIYVAACALSAPSGLILALGTTAGPVAAAGFAVQALLLPIFTYWGLKAALERRFANHREWMLRSYALTSAAITLRLMLPASALLGIGFLPAYQVIAWLAWTTNLVVFELYIRRKRVADESYPALATA